MSNRIAVMLEARAVGSGLIKRAAIRDALIDLDRAVDSLPDDLKKLINFVYSNLDLNRTDCAAALGVCSKTLKRKLDKAHELIENKLVF